MLLQLTGSAVAARRCRGMLWHFAMESAKGAEVIRGARGACQEIAGCRRLLSGSNWVTQRNGDRLALPPSCIGGTDSLDRPHTIGPAAGARCWPRLRQAIQTTVAACLAYVVAELLGLPQGFWAVMTAILVTQANVGASLGLAVDRLLGSLLGVVVGGGVAAGAGRRARVRSIAGLAVDGAGARVTSRRGARRCASPA